MVHVSVLYVTGVSLCSTRNYTVPDPPGLFDGHVWPMYLKHKNIMEASGVNVGKSMFLCLFCFFSLNCVFIFEMTIFPIT